MSLLRQAMMILAGSAVTTLLVSWIRDRFRAPSIMLKEVDIVITNKFPATPLAVHNDDHILSLPLAVSMSKVGRYHNELPCSVRLFDANKATTAITPVIWSAGVDLYHDTPFSLVFVDYNTDTGVATALIDNTQPLVDNDGNSIEVTRECCLLMHLPHVRIRKISIINKLN